MKVLLHVCCGPCATFPVEALREAGHEVTGFWYNPNVHPYQEYMRRLEAARSHADQVGLHLIVHDEYGLREFVRAVAFREEQRHVICYEMRLRRTAAVAKSGHFDAFTSTLLVSPHQQHETIRDIGEQVAAEVGVPLYYEDFRPGYKREYELSKRYGLYRQPYCGCIYSEYERFGPKQERTPR